MTLTLSNILPSELIREIADYDKDYVYYCTHYDTISWNTVEEKLDYISYHDMCDFVIKTNDIVESIDPKVNKFGKEKWLIMDYIKMHPGKRWFWSDECMNTSRYVDYLLEFLEVCDKEIQNGGKYVERVKYVNELFKHILDY